jgi:hypothetical protein
MLTNDKLKKPVFDSAAACFLKTGFFTLNPQQQLQEDERKTINVVPSYRSYPFWILNFCNITIILLQHKKKLSLMNIRANC